MSSSSSCPVGCLLLLLVRSHPPLGSLVIACSRLRPLSSPSGCPVACCCSSSTPAARLTTVCSLLRPLSSLSVLLLAAIVRSHPSCPLVPMPAQLSTDRLLSLANAGCPLRLAVLSAACCCCLFVHIRRVHWCCCPSGSLLIACSRLRMLDVLFV